MIDSLVGGLRRLLLPMKPLRVRLSYGDHNDSFRTCLPRDGTIRKFVRLEGAVGHWAVLQLDSPIEYEGRVHQRVVIRSRWRGHAVGGLRPTSVFVLLAPADAPFEASLPAFTDFQHVAWGEVRTLGSAA